MTVASAGPVFPALRARTAIRYAKGTVGDQLKTLVGTLLVIQGVTFVQIVPSYTTH